MNTQRGGIYKALGEVENAVFQVDDLPGVYREDEHSRFLMEALAKLGDVVKMMGLPDLNDLNGTDCRIHCWREVAVLAVCAIAHLRAAQEQQGT